jgi:hypothetical protein
MKCLMDGLGLVYGVSRHSQQYFHIVQFRIDIFKAMNREAVHTSCHFSEHILLCYFVVKIHMYCFEAEKCIYSIIKPRTYSIRP